MAAPYYPPTGTNPNAMRSPSVRPAPPPPVVPPPMPTPGPMPPQGGAPGGLPPDLLAQLMAELLAQRTGGPSPRMRDTHLQMLGGGR